VGGSASRTSGNWLMVQRGEM